MKTRSRPRVRVILEATGYWWIEVRVKPSKRTSEWQTIGDWQPSRKAATKYANRIRSCLRLQREELR